MSSADHVQLEKSLSDEMGGASPFTDKQYLYVNDQNNGNYSGTITIDSTTLSNSGSYIGWSESYLLIPLVLQLYSDNANVSATSNVDFAMAMKCGFWQILHSMSVDFNNGSVVQQTPFLNVFSSFKNLTSWSDADIKCWGKITGFAPDTHDSWVFNNLTAADNNGLQGSGVGFCNNRLVKTIPPTGLLTDVAFATAATIQVINTEVTLLSDSSLSCANTGLLQRMKWLNFDLTQESPGFAAGSTSSQKALLLANSTSSSLEGLFKPFVRTADAVAAGRNRGIIFPAIVRMKDVCDFFDKMPLMKGATFRLQINTNQCLCQFKMTNGGITAADGTIVGFPSLQLTAPPTMLGGGGTCPFMVSSNDFGQGLNPLAPTAATVGANAVSLFVSCSIVRSQFTSSTMTQSFTAPINSVRLYAPAYTMSPQAEAAYLSQQPTKKIVYEDIFQYQFNTIGTSTWNYLVTNGLPNLRSLLVIPFLPAASNGVVTAGAGKYQGGVLTSTLLSPFASSGATPDPIALTNFQVQISGKNLFNDVKQYDYQEFVEQLVSSNQLNGSLTTGLASGLIGMDEYDTLYRYYYADAARCLPSEAGVPRSIQISGQNLSGREVNLMVFASFERTITVDLRSGARLD
jgi:hypothetical protein